MTLISLRVTYDPLLQMRKLRPGEKNYPSKVKVCSQRGCGKSPGRTSGFRNQWPRLLPQLCLL